MVRLPRLVFPGYPHHVTQRGNRRGPTFFADSDYALYCDLLGASAEKAETAIWCYYLMPNHVHVIAVPSDEDGLRRTFADAPPLHRLHHARHRWTGHLWQGRFGAVAMDEAHLFNAVRYVSLNPVRARLVPAAADWRWSSVRALPAGEDDGLVEVAPVLARYGDFAAFLAAPGEDDAKAWRALWQSETSGRPIGDAAWIGMLEAYTGRPLAPQKRGPKPRLPP